MESVVFMLTAWRFYLVTSDCGAAEVRDDAEYDDL
jgi:hypothetical protein